MITACGPQSFIAVFDKDLVKLKIDQFGTSFVIEQEGKVHKNCSLLKTASLNSRYLVIGTEDGRIEIRDTQDLTSAPLLSKKLSKNDHIVDCELITGVNGSLYILSKTSGYIFTLDADWKLGDTVKHQIDGEVDKPILRLC